MRRRRTPRYFDALGRQWDACHLSRWRFWYYEANVNGDLNMSLSLLLHLISHSYYTSFLSSAYDGRTSWSTGYAVEGSDRNVVFRKFS